MLNWANKSKRWLVILLAASLLLSSCNKQAHTAMTSYVMANGLILETPDMVEYVDDQGVEVTIYSRQISGLKDKAVEEKINTRIDQMVEELLTADLPAYRGIKVQVGDAICRSKWLNVNDMGNFNNILSLNLYRGLDFERLGEYGAYVSQIRTLNIDLNTGEEITLADLFPEGSNYLEMLSAIVAEELAKEQATEEYSYGFMNLQQVAPFTGVKANQKFSVSPWGLTLYFDEDTPELVTADFYPANLTISNWQLKELGAFAQKFYDSKQSLYTDETLASPELISWGQTPDAGLNEYEEKDGIDFSVMCQYSTTFPENVQAKIVELAQPDPQVWESLRSIDAQLQNYYSINVWAQQYGDYISVGQNIHWNQPDKQRTSPDNQRMHMEDRGYVFDASTGEKVELEDLFQPGFDYLVAMENTASCLENGWSKEDLADIFDQAGWTLSENGIGTHVLERDGEFYCYLHIPYSELGIENMTIFH